MNLKEIRELINLMNENELSEIAIEREGTKIKLKKGSDELVEVAPRRAEKYKSAPAAVTIDAADVAPSAGKIIKSKRNQFTDGWYFLSSSFSRFSTIR